MYTTTNFPTKKALKEAVAEYLKEREFVKRLEAAHIPMKNVTFKYLAKPVTLYAPGLGSPVRDGWETVEGPHYPQLHKWYARVFVVDGIVTKVQ